MTHDRSHLVLMVHIHNNLPVLSMELCIYIRFVAPTISLGQSW